MPLTLMPLVWVSDMDRAVTFYEILGGVLVQQSRSQNWAELEFGGALLALHRADSLPEIVSHRLDLCFVVEALEPLVARLEQAGIVLNQAITDEAFGRSLTIKDPDGLIITFNEHDSELYA